MGEISHNQSINTICNWYECYFLSTAQLKSIVTFSLKSIASFIERDSYSRDPHSRARALFHTNK